MLDFLVILTENPKQGQYKILPDFDLLSSKDLMTKGGDFFAVWDEEKGLWSKEEDTVIRLVDTELDEFAKKFRAEHKDSKVRVMHMRESRSGSIDQWHRFVKTQKRDSFRPLDDKIIFSNYETTKKDYATKKLNYAIENAPTPAYDQLLSVLYSPTERHKIEWAIGAVISGDSKKLQKFMVFYGPPGSGKGTVLDLIADIFGGYENKSECGYCSAFDASALASESNQFPLEAFKSNPLVAIDSDGDLSRIETNTRLNSLVSHETMAVNTKNKSVYPEKFNSFLFIASNKTVKITDAQSGILRRLIDISPTGNTIPAATYEKLKDQLQYELGGIAYHCLEVYKENPKAYNDYVPLTMFGATNDFYNFVLDSYDIFERDNCTTLSSAYEMYKAYASSANIPYPMKKLAFKEELKNYFREYKVRHTLEDGSRPHDFYYGFILDKFKVVEPLLEEPEEPPNTFIFDQTESLFDTEMADCLAQYASEGGTPIKKWANVTSKLSELDTHKLHYVKVPENLIVIDFDIKGDDGAKSFERNLAEANKWPATYAELSKSGAGIHLHYIYTGDPKRLSSVYNDNVEIKVFTGGSSLRRMLTKCNDIPIASISSGLPLKEEKAMISKTTIENEKHLAAIIEKCLRKEVGLSPTEIEDGKKAKTVICVNCIYDTLENAYSSGMHYDVSNYKPRIISFAAQSTNSSEACLRKVSQMKFQSEDVVMEITDEQGKLPLCWFDVEVASNFFGVSYMTEDEVLHRMINPTKEQMMEFLQTYSLIGFNCRRYDNHICWYRATGKNNLQLYDISRRIINKDSTAFARDAYNLSELDLYDVASTKQSLKKWEYQLQKRGDPTGVRHKELGLKWNEPWPEDRWEEVMDYCDNDVRATKAVWDAIQPDITARKMLVELCKRSGLPACMNDTTNQLTTKIIFGNEKNPELVYTELGKPQPTLAPEIYNFWNSSEPTRSMLHHNWALEHGEASIRPWFPGYEFVNGHNMYRGEDVGFGGYVYAEPGMYTDVALLDIQSMHPSSIIAMYMFGPYTQRFKDIYDARVLIKHHDYDTAKKLLNGAFESYLTDENAADQLSKALKIAINSVYGLTSASFSNPFRDERNVNNIVALRGALFMVNLKHEVQDRGFTVAHIKTDSIKIPNATPEIIEFCKEYALKYGYIFEHEATYEKMCLVNDAVYVAQHALDSKEWLEECEKAKRKGKPEPTRWTATGTQFQVPYVFKTLFSHEPITFDDKCEVKSVTSALYLDMNEGLPEGQHDYQFVGKVGQFCPIKKGCGGGVLLREVSDDKYASATGAKGYRWLDSDTVWDLQKEDDIDLNYYRKMVDEAITAISKYGDATWFMADETATDEPPPFDPPYTQKGA